MFPPLTLAALRGCYIAGELTPRTLLERLLDVADDERHVWITRLSRAQVMRYVDALGACAAADIAAKPLFGIPFVIKDNIDLAGVPTTAGCPAFTYTPERSAAVVERLIEAGAIPLGKANLDQFATGLVGARSPYGACLNAFDPDFISGGSSSGSAVAVARGLAAFALGTDTAGSGRVPAAFNNLIGMKPSNGALSTRGVVPACRSLDCVSVFALTAEDARTVLDVAAGFDAQDVYSRTLETVGLGALRAGIPRRDQLQFFGDAQYARLYDEAVAHLQALDVTPVEFDLEPFVATARLLYEGPWVAERYAAVGEFIDGHAAEVHPVTREIILAGKLPSAVELFRAQYRLREHARHTAATWERVDLLCLPTAGTIHRLSDLEREPLRLNAQLGLYTNFVNLLDLCTVAVPAGFRADGLPFGVSLVGPRGADRALLDLAGRLQRRTVTTVGALGQPLPALPTGNPDAGDGVDGDEWVALAVCGAHMRGLPLNPQLTSRGARFRRLARTAARYRLYALPGGPPQRPGLVRVIEGGAAIELEVWALPAARLGSFAAGIPAPLGLGRIELSEGPAVLGFLCEGYAREGAHDITATGGWRAHLAQAR